MLRMITLSLFRHFVAMGMIVALWVAAACTGDGRDTDIAVPPPLADTREPRPPAAGLDDPLDEFVRDARNQVNDLDDRIEGLERKADNLAGEFRAEVSRRLEELGAKVEGLKLSLRDVELGGEEAYEELKSEIESALRAAMSELEDLEAELGT